MPCTNRRYAPSSPVSGLAWEVRRSGLGEVAGVPQEVLRAFSKRRVEVEKALADRGLDSARAAEVATLSTRSAKPEVTRSTETLRAGWEDELAAVAVPDDDGGFRAASIEDVLGVVDSHRTRDAEVDTEAIFAVLAGEHGVAVSDYDLDAASSARAVPLTLLASTFSRRDALWAVAKAFDATTAEVVALTDELLARPSVVRVLSGPGPSRRRSESEREARSQRVSATVVTRRWRC